MASHGESELKQMWNSFDNSDRFWIAQHCAYNEGLGNDYDNAVKNVGGPAEYQGNIFRNAIVYVNGGRRGELYTRSNDKTVYNFYKR